MIRTLSVIFIAPDTKRIRMCKWVLISVAAVAALAGCAPPPQERPQSPAVRSADIALPRDVRLVSARVAAGDTLTSLLRANNVAQPDAIDVVAEAQQKFDVRKVRTTQPYRLEQAADGRLNRFEYEIDRDQLLRVIRDGRELRAEVVPIEKTRHLEIVEGTISRDAPSLVAALDEAGETIELAIDLAGIFGGEIDFNNELQPGDHFALLVEKQYRHADPQSSDADVPFDDRVENRKLAIEDRQSRFLGYGPIMAAEFENDGRRVRAIRFTPDGGTPAYFDEHGVSMRRFFLRSPLKFDPVVTSGFSRARMHPVLHEVRAHLGVDYRAPVGAPVVAVADGVVLEAGTAGGAGRMVHLRHANSFESEYLHLSSIAVRIGSRVRQGDLVGRVGATGLATGPHLDYRLKKNGVFINPLTAHRAMPPGEPVPPALMPAFVVARDRVLADLREPAVANASAKASVGNPNGIVQ